MARVVAFTGPRTRDRAFGVMLRPDSFASKEHPMKVGIIGSGAVAQALAEGFIAHGHEVALGTRDTNKLADFAAAHPKARVVSMADAAAFGEVAVLAVKGSGAMHAAREAAPHLDGKAVLDTTNPIADAAPVDGVLSFFTGPNESLLERLQHEYPRVKFVKAFNSVGSDHMVDPKFAGGPPTMFIAGNDDGAKSRARSILAEFGWDVADMGSAIAARAIEPLCILWCIPGLREGAWTHAFRLLR
jgi:predicted dinucleotide-binding enzyme